MIQKNKKSQGGVGAALADFFCMLLCIWILTFARMAMAGYSFWKRTYSQLFTNLFKMLKAGGSSGTAIRSTPFSFAIP